MKNRLLIFFTFFMTFLYSNDVRNIDRNDWLIEGNGYVVTVENDTINGYVYVDEIRNLIFVDNKKYNKWNAYSPIDVRYAKIEEVTQYYRQTRYVIPLRIKDNANKRILFVEVNLVGDISLFAVNKFLIDNKEGIPKIKLQMYRYVFYYLYNNKLKRYETFEKSIKPILIKKGYHDLILFYRENKNRGKYRSYEIRLLVDLLHKFNKRQNPDYKYERSIEVQL